MKKLFNVIAFCSLFLNSFCQLNMSAVGTLNYTQDLSDIWGYKHPTNGKEYALVGVYNGFSVVDISTPASPVEIYFENGVNSIWRDIKTWNGHAYVTTEGGDGLLIINLDDLPGTVTKTYYTGLNFPFTTAHNLYIDENGVAYIFGANYENGGAIMLDLTNDPLNPIELGVFDEYYLHDGVVRNDTLWGSAINDGVQLVIDVTDKTTPELIASWSTPSNFSHNCWFSDDGNFLYTTDEKPFAYIGSYDVSDLNNVKEVDRWQSNPGTGTIPHNVHFYDNYIITSYYADGVTICDVTRPDIVVEVGNYDTSPLYAGNDAGGFHGCWGVYPWLPSGLIIAADIENGLYVLQPNYTRASYLVGKVNDLVCGTELKDVKVEILSTNAEKYTDISGNYKTGFAGSGTYDVRFSKTGYDTQTISNVVFTEGEMVELNVDLNSTQIVSITGNISGNMQGAHVIFVNNQNKYQLMSDVNGNFAACNILSGTYDIHVSKWGYITLCEENVTVDNSNNQFNFTLVSGYYDDFYTDNNWVVSGNASAGIWERGKPIGTFYFGQPSNPGSDVSEDCLDFAYVTGNGGGGAGEDDIDNGSTILTSPVLNFPASIKTANLTYYSWFFNAGGSSTPNDSLIVRVHNGITSAVLDIVTVNSPNNSSWVKKEFNLQDYITLSTNITISFEAKDDEPGHLVEAGLDMFQVMYTISSVEEWSQNNIIFKVYPNPFQSTIQIDTDGKTYILEAFDVTGKLIYQDKLSNSNQQISFHDWENGLYLLKLSDEKGDFSIQKITKQ
jgi:choice-of-anchor B domain-containing protein